VPVRAPPGFADTVKLTFPAPVLDEPSTMAIHETFEIAVHVHPPDVETATAPLPPEVGNDWLDGEMENAQPAA
jgi:hypothetical protein